MNISLRVEETTKYLALYQRFLEDVQQLNKRVSDELNEIMIESKYDRIQHEISATIDTYTDLVVNNADNGAFAIWEQSRGSLRSCLRTYKAGEAADKVCAETEQRMVDMMQEILHIDKEIPLITDRPVVTEEGLDQLEDIFGSAHNEILEIKSEYLTQARNLNEDNAIYGTLCPLFTGLTVKLESFFEDSQSRFEKLHDFVRDTSAQFSRMAEENGTGGNSSAVSSKSDASDNGHTTEDDGRNSKKSVTGDPDDIFRILGIKKDEKFSDENVKLAVIIVEKMVDQVGADELNSSVEKHYDNLSSAKRSFLKRIATQQRFSGESVTAKKEKSNLYGRYIVTEHSRQVMENLCSQADSIFKPLDKFYKEKFKMLGDNYDKANAVIHRISSFLALYGLGTWNLSKLISSTDSDSTIFEKVALVGVAALATNSNAGKIIKGGGDMLRLMDWFMPHLKKSRILVKLSEKFWNLTKQDIQVPYINKMMDQYMMEHYELKYGMNGGQSGYFTYYHEAVATIKDNRLRRIFEDAVFSAESYMTPQHYTIHETDQKKIRAICTGLFLNLARSGMCNEHDMKSDTANVIVDKMYDIYIAKENITPRVDISPDQKVIV